MVVRSECRRTESERKRLLTAKRLSGETADTTSDAFATDSIATVADRVRNFESSGKKRREERREPTSSSTRREKEIEDAERCTKIRNP